ncbi:MAG TPA: LURP-one-related family protein [Thermomicrobiales bacterium]|nr:LURP-one-related family protein [Thermomicrobiales bacterium]
MVAIGNDFFIQDDQGNRAYQVDGKALRARDTLVFRDMEGKELCRIQQRVMRLKDTMEINGPDGGSIAHVRKALITPLRDRYTVRIGTGPDLDVTGNILDHEFSIGDGRKSIAEVSKRWFRVRDSYGVEVDPGQDVVVILAATVCIDQMSNPAK